MGAIPSGGANLRRVPRISLARDKSGRPVRGSLHGDLPVGPCEAANCGKDLYRGDQFVTYLGDRPMCLVCHESGAPLKPLPAAAAAPQLCIAGTRAKRGGRPRKKEQLAALRAARTEQLRESR